MNKKSIVILIIAIGFGAGLVSVVGQARDSTDSAAVEVTSVDIAPAPSEQEEPVVEPRARRILQAMGEYLKTAKAFSLHG